MRMEHKVPGSVLPRLLMVDVGIQVLFITAIFMLSAVLQTLITMMSSMQRSIRMEQLAHGLVLPHLQMRYIDIRVLFITAISMLLEVFILKSQTIIITMTYSMQRSMQMEQ
jgi:hypothetical protein